MVLEEVLQEVRADDVACGLALAAERVGDVAQILLQGLLAVGRLNERDRVGNDVVVAEVVVVRHGDYPVVVAGVRGIGDARKVIGFGGALVCEDQAVLVERIAAHHAADRIAEQAFYLALQVGLAH